MSDHQIFISYAREDREAAQRLAKALGRDGWSVWWDRKLVAGTSFDSEIDAALTRAACVVVLWSETAVASDWVKNEATEGLKRRVLVPVLLANVRMPLQFRHLHAVDLVGWSGEPDHPEYEDLLRAVRGLTAAAPAASVADASAVTTTATHARTSAATARPAYSRRRVVVAGGAALVAAVGGVAWSFRGKALRRLVTDSELEHLRNACRSLSRKMAARQESDGSYKANPYDQGASAHVTAQVLSGLLASVQTSSGDFGREPSARGARVLCGFANEVSACRPSGDAVAATLDPNDAALRGLKLGWESEDRHRTVPAGWAALALARYLAMYDDHAASLAFNHLRQMLLEWGIEDGSFQFSCDPVNRNHPNAYATVLAVMALLECPRALVDEKSERKLAQATEWLAKTFPAPSNGDEVALQAVNGLAAQAFWALEQARKGTRERQRTPAEERVASLLFRDLLKQCRQGAPPEESCIAPNGRIPFGWGSQLPLVMLWLPWSTLAAIELGRTPPRDAKPAELEAMRDATRTLVIRLAAYGGDVSADSFRYEPAEILFAMAEALRVLANPDSGD